MQRVLFTGILLLLASHADAQTVAVPANGGAGGTNATIWKAQCAQGMVMTGIEILVGGTCHNQCDADGRPLATFRILCSPLKGGTGINLMDSER
jgi:hypothetical protein